MEQTVIPSTEPLTEGQIGKILQFVGDRLRKTKLPSKSLQDVIEKQGSALADKFVSNLSEMVDAVSNMIIRHVKVNLKRSAKEALKATGREQYVSDDVAKNMPKAVNEEAEIIFFKVGKEISCAGLEKEYEFRGLIPADPYSLASVNEADPAFADEKPNGTQWKDSQGNYCCAIFYLWCGERFVDVYRDDHDWRVDWWFAGVRKSELGS
jgi:hypothetical protein